MFICLIIGGGAQGICASGSNCSADLLTMDPSMAARLTRHCCHSISAARQCARPLILRCPWGTAWCTRTLLIGLAAPVFARSVPMCLPEDKIPLRSYHFETVDGIQRTVTDDALKNSQKTSSNAFRDWRFASSSESLLSGPTWKRNMLESKNVSNNFF